MIQDSQILLPYPLHVCFRIDRSLLRRHRLDVGYSGSLQQDRQLPGRRHRLRRPILPDSDGRSHDVRRPVL